MHAWFPSLLLPSGAVLYARFPSTIFARRSALTYGVCYAALWTDCAPDKVWLPHKNAFYTLKVRPRLLQPW